MAHRLTTSSARPARNLRRNFTLTVAPRSSPWSCRSRSSGVVAADPPGRRQRHRAVAGRRRVHRLHEARRHGRPARRRRTATSTRTRRSSRSRYVDQPEAYEEFKTLFPDSPEMTESLRIERMPPSSASCPSPTTARSSVPSAPQFEGKPGVFAVEYAKEALDWLRSISRFLRVGSIIVAGVLLARRCC